MPCCKWSARFGERSCLPRQPECSTRSVRSPAPEYGTSHRTPYCSPTSVIFQAKFTSVVKQPGAICRVVNGRRVSANALAFHANRSAQLVLCEALLRNMAHRAGDRIVHRQAPVKEQFSTELNFAGSQQIVARYRYRPQSERRRLQHRQQICLFATSILQADGTGPVVGTFIAIPDIARTLMRFGRIGLRAAHRCQQQHEEQRPPELLD